MDERVREIVNMTYEAMEKKLVMADEMSIRYALDYMKKNKISPGKQKKLETELKQRYPVTEISKDTRLWATKTKFASRWKEMQKIFGVAE